MSDSMVGGSNSATPLGSGQRSSNAALGIEKRVETGTNGSRPNMGAEKYGGDKAEGTLFKGNSAAPSGQQNVGGSEKTSASGGYYGPTSSVDSGTVGSREGMTIGGGKNTGKLFGEGAKGGSNSSPEVVKKVQPGMDVVKGTSDGDKNLSRALKGIGGKGNKQA